MNSLCCPGFGTLDIRRTVTNLTGENVTRLRWRIIDITTHPTPNGIADLRARTSTPLPVTVDRPPCGSGTSEVVVQGTTLETPPVQTLGGGFNSTLSSGTITLDTPLLDSQSLDVRFLLGIQKTGSFKFFIDVEALTREPVIIVPEEEIPTERPSGAGSPLGPTVRPRKGLTALTTNTGETAPSAGASQGASATPVKAGNGVGTLPVRTFIVVRVIPPKESELAGAKSSKAKKRKRAAARARQGRRE